MSETGIMWLMSIVAAGVVVLFAVTFLRGVILWYFKINDIVRCLEIIAEKETHR